MLRKLLPHGAIILSGMYFVFFFIDKVNSPMAFINNDITKGLLFALCVISVVNALFLIRDDRRRVRQREERVRQMRMRSQQAARSSSGRYQHDDARYGRYR